MVKSHNPVFKRQLAKAIAYLYKENSPVAEYLREGYVKMSPWATEKDDKNNKIKYKGQPYWTMDAILSFRTKKSINGLRHEHPIPNKIIRQKLFENTIDEEKIFEILDKLVHVVIVTMDEASEIDKKFKTTLPVEFKISNEPEYIFSRYKESGINVFYIEHGDPSKLSEIELKNLIPII
jgi:hypothetical protein